MKSHAGKLYWTIGEVAEIFEIATSHIRSWDKAGLYTNAHIVRRGPARLWGCDRRFTSDGIVRTALIGVLTVKVGLSLFGVRKAFKLGYATELVQLYSIYAKEKDEENKTKKA